MKFLVTGGGGFVGGAVCRLLRARGDAVVSFSRGAYPELERLGVACARGEIDDAGALARAAEGCAAMIHCAAKPGLWGEPAEFRRVNVEGTRAALAACREAGVRRLVFTSSPSVVFDGRDMEGVDETLPYPARHDSEYSATKAEAERLVLAANGPELATVALRPHLIWGPGDNHILPRLVERRRRGLLRRLSGPEKKVDTTFIDNAAEAHLAAADRLAPGAGCAGRAYFISNGEPLPLWTVIDRLLGAAGLPPVDKTISPRAAYAAGAACEWAYRLLRLRSEPRMTRFLAKELATAHWFDLAAARRDLGYAPRVSVDDGMRRLAAELSAKADSRAILLPFPCRDAPRLP